MNVVIDAKCSGNEWKERWDEAGQWYSQSADSARVPDVVEISIRTLARFWPSDGVAIVIRRVRQNAS